MIRRTYEPLLPPLSYGEQCLVQAMVDPGHNAAILQDATPFPDGRFGNRSILLPCQLDMDIDVQAGHSKIVLVPNLPGIAALLAEDTSGAIVMRGVPHPAWSGKEPGTFMRDHNLARVRALGKSLTATNVTPMADRGGFVYARNFSVNSIVRGVEDSTNAVPIQDAKNVFTLLGLPNCPRLFLESGYKAMGPEGAYVIGRSVDLGGEEIDAMEKQLSTVYTNATCPVGDHYTNALAYTQSDLADTSAASQYIYNYHMRDVSTGAFPLHHPGVTDGFNVFGVCITAPASASQTFHLKIHMLHEYAMPAGSPCYLRGHHAAPNQALVDVVNQVWLLLDQIYPEEYNSWASVWNWVKKAYRNNRRYIDPLLSQIPVIGPTGAAVGLVNSAIQGGRRQAA